MPTTHFIVTGTVQGVGFRRFVLHHAHQLGLRGFVCNLEDETVECIAQGSTDALTEMETLLRTGPQHAHVSSVICNDLNDGKIYSSFRIL